MIFFLNPIMELSFLLFKLLATYNFFRICYAKNKLCGYQGTSCCTVKKNIEISHTEREYLILYEIVAVPYVLCQRQLKCGQAATINTL
jgi:hypothetical protein